MRLVHEQAGEAADLWNVEIDIVVAYQVLDSLARTTGPLSPCATSTAWRLCGSLSSSNAPCLPPRRCWFAPMPRPRGSVGPEGSAVNDPLNALRVPIKLVDPTRIRR